jgi:hypothetical protein
MFGLEGLACQANLKVPASAFWGNSPVTISSAVANPVLGRNLVKLWRL